jgi:hypothetical protein
LIHDGDHAVDFTVRIQNGICAFAVDQQQLFREAIRVIRSGGLVMFSSYTPQFWQHRLGNASQIVGVTQGHPRVLVDSK